jgi:DNA repair protein RecO (recombination protein O)
MSQPRVYKAQAIVLRRISVGETDRILTLFTREYGKLSAIAKGARRSVSRLAAATEPLTFSRVLLAVGQNLDVLTQGEVRAAFPEIRADLTRISYASYFSELANAGLEERQPNPDLFDLLLSSFHILSHSDQPDLVARAFELQALRLLGYQPELRQCVRCRAALHGSGLGFSASRGGGLCARCNAETPATLSMSGAALELMRRLIDAEPVTLARLRPNQAQRSELAGLLVPYVRQRTEAQLRSLGFIEELRVAPPEKLAGDRRQATDGPSSAPTEPASTSATAVDCRPSPDA